MNIKLRLIDLPTDVQKPLFPAAEGHLARTSLPMIFSWGNPWGDTSYENMVELRAEIDREAVTVEVETLPLYDKARHATDLHHFSGRTDEHREVCARASDWLIAHGLGTPVFLEPTYPFGFNVRADVGSADDKTLIEAGYTYSAKVLQALPMGLVVGVAPYAEHVGLRDEVLFIFRRMKPLRRESIPRFTKNPLAGVL